MDNKGKDRDYGDCEEIVEAVMEMIGKRWTKSMIKAELRKWFPGLTDSSAQWIITQAKRLICKIYNIDPHEYKGKQIAFYESVIRGGAKVHDKLTAAERLDKLFGLEHITMEDPALMAQKIIEFKKQAEATVGGTGGQSNGGSEHEGSRENNAGTDGSQEKKELDTEKTGAKCSIEEDGSTTPEDPEVKANIDDVLKKQSKPEESE